MMPEHTIIINSGTYKMIGALSREYKVSMGEMVDVLAVEQVLREALHDDPDAPVVVSSEVWEKIRGKLKRP